MRICGKHGGDTFEQVNRPALNGSCEDKNLLPCISDAPADVTICYAPELLAENCPITDIAIIENAVEEEFVTNGYSVISFNDTASVAFSKTVP